MKKTLLFASLLSLSGAALMVSGCGSCCDKKEEVAKQVDAVNTEVAPTTEEHRNVEVADAQAPVAESTVVAQAEPAVAPEDVKG